MNLLYPKFAFRLLPRMLLIAVLGALVGGIYGVIHDELTYSISSEYFTKLKFDQFRYANFGFPERVLVAEVGFLATGAVGFFAAWFLARIAVPVWPLSVALRNCGKGFGIIISVAILSAAAGDFLGLHHSSDYSYWENLCEGLGVDDIPAFARVGIIHVASYLGGLVGLVIAILYGRQLRGAKDLATWSRPSHKADSGGSFPLTFTASRTIKKTK